jgi:hypothetical protein
MVMSKHQDLQQILFGEIVFDNDFRKIKKIQDDVKNNDDFNYGQIYMIDKDINNVIYILNTYFTVKKIHHSQPRKIFLIPLTYVYCPVRNVKKHYTSSHSKK